MKPNGSGFEEVVHVFIFISSLFALVDCEDFPPPKSEVTFHNLIPRFKMPRGNLLRYQIPQWEVLYFLKYGIVPFIFYDPNFNRTNFVSQVHKFQMYFDDGRPNKIPPSAMKDDEAFREYLRKNGHPNYNQLPENASSRNYKMFEEINGLLRTVNDAAFKNNAEKGKHPPPFPPLDINMEHAGHGGLPPEKSPGESQPKMSKKRSTNTDQESNARIRQSFWDTFINRHPLTWKYRKSFLLGSPHNFPLDGDPTESKPRSFSLSDLRRYIKSSRIGTRNVNMEGAASSGPEDGVVRTGTGNEPRRNNKNFQTQGWR